MHLCSQLFFFFSLEKSVPSPATLVFLLTCCQVEEGKGKGGFVFENSTVYKWLPLVCSIGCGVSFSNAWLQAPRPVPEEGTMSSFTHPVHRAWPLLQILSPVTAGMSCASLLFLKLIVHVTDFRCLRSQVLENMRQFKNYRRKAQLFEPTSATSLRD